MTVKRKKWTAKLEITDSLLKVREKKKWQLAFRRYVVEKNISVKYAKYFGLDIENYRKWIELQFTEGLNWDNFGTFWQFDHIIPVAYFNFSLEEDLKLCWNFINTRIENTQIGDMGASRIDILAAKPYFESLYAKTGFSICLKMLDKISDLEKNQFVISSGLEEFIIQNKEQFEKMSTLSTEEYKRINKGMGLVDLILEKEILKKYG